MWNEICPGRSSYNEKFDCTVVTTSQAFDMSYPEAHAALAARGRRPRRPFFYDDTMYALAAQQGKALRPVEGIRGTVSTITRKLPRRGTYIVFTRGHVLCVRDGQVRDWTDGRRHRILRVYEVCDPSAPTAPTPAPAPVRTRTVVREHLTFNTTANPHRPGTRSYDMWCQLLNCSTVSCYYSLGGRKADIAFWTRKGYITTRGL